MSAEEKLKNLLQEFKVILFDVGEDKSGLVMQKQSRKPPREVDAIALKDNILILITIYDGRGEQKIGHKIKPFFRDLSYFNSVCQLNLEVVNRKARAGRINHTKISELIQEISASDYKFIVIKLAFCPNLYVPAGKITLRPNESVIDKKHLNYFNYILDTLGYTYMERELFYFLKIKRRLMKLQKGSRAGDEPELTKDFPAIEIDLGPNQKMYFACVSVNDIIEYIQVLRIAEEYDVKAFQRMVNKEMLKKISNYLETHKTFPNNVILAFNPDIYDPEKVNHFVPNHNRIKFYKEFGSLIIIDGQHRLLAHLLDPSRDLKKPILINVVLFSNREKAYDEMAELFYTINTKQKRLVSLVSLKIRSRIDPSSIEGMWYIIFEQLNKLAEKDNYLHNRISFEEKEIREDSDKMSISSIIQYAGLKRITNGPKLRGRKYLGLKDLGKNCVSENYKFPDFYQNFLRKYFSIIGEILGSDISISPRDLGGLIRLIIHFINDNKTKELFGQLSEERGETTSKLKNKIKNYLNEIPFSQLSQVEYAAQHWAAMEGFFLGCIRRRHKRFGFSPLLSRKGKSALHKGKQFDEHSGGLS